MAVTDYSSLQTAIASRLHRSLSDTDANGTTMASVIQECISLAENNMSAQVKARAMESRSTLTATAGNAYIALPTDLVESRRLIITSTDPQRVLKYVTPDELSSSYPYSRQGTPDAWTVIGSNIQLGSIPDAAYTLELTYLQKIPALSGVATTNWLLTAYPDVYLYGTLVQMCQYTMDLEKLAVYKGLYEEAVQAVNAIDWYSGSTMAVRSA